MVAGRCVGAFCGSLLCLIVLVVGGAIAVVVVERPTLEDARDAVDNRWKPLQEPLATRYAQAHHCAGGARRGRLRRPERVQRSRARPRRLEGARSPAAIPGPRPKWRTDLEADGKRLKANAYGSPVLTKVDGLVPAITGFDSAAPSAPLVDVVQQGGARLRERTATTPCASRLRGCSASTPARCS